MSPLNECNKKVEKLERQLKSLQIQLEREKDKHEKLLRMSAKEKLYTVMYSSMFKSVLSSIEEDLEHARTAKEAREWVTDITNRFKPAFASHESNGSDSFEEVSNGLGIEFDRTSLRMQYDSIYAEMKRRFDTA